MERFLGSMWIWEAPLFDLNTFILFEKKATQIAQMNHTYAMNRWFSHIAIDYDYNYGVEC